MMGGENGEAQASLGEVSSRDPTQSGTNHMNDSISGCPPDDAKQATRSTSIDPGSASIQNNEAGRNRRNEEEGMEVDMNSVGGEAPATVEISMGI